MQTRHTKVALLWPCFRTWRRVTESLRLVGYSRRYRLGKTRHASCLAGWYSSFAGWIQSQGRAKTQAGCLVIPWCSRVQLFESFDCRFPSSRSAPGNGNMIFDDWQDAKHFPGAISILKDPESVQQVLNPCDANTAKRPWEYNLLTMRRPGHGWWSQWWCVAWCRSHISLDRKLRFSVPFELENDHGFVDLVVEKAATAFSAPSFCFEVTHAGIILDARLTWEDLGFPKQVQLVRIPTSLEWTEDLFEAVDWARNLWGAMWIRGQCHVIVSHNILEF